MHRVFGKVLVHETSDGIPNVVVGVFDRDVAPPAPPAPPTHAGTLAPPPAARFGERIGSTLTDAHGGFELAFDADLFAAGDPEKRPDLVLAVFAPEDARAPSDPTALPAEQRLLVVSDVDRRDAGRTEAFVLRVHRATLDRFRIPHGDARTPGDPRGERLVDSIERAWDAGHALRARLGSRFQSHLAHTRDRATNARALFAALGAAPAAARRGPLYVHRGERPDAAQAAAIELGMQHVAAYDERAHDGMRLRLTQRELTGMGVQGIDGHVDVEVGIAAVIDAARRRAAGQTLVRDRAIGDACRDRDVLDAAFAPEEDGAQPAEEPVAEEIAEEAAVQSADEQVLARVLGQLHDLETSDADAIDDRADARRLQAELDALELTGGPADVSALHDFSVLQLAFRHVWTEAFDESIREQAAQLYDAAVQLAEDLGVEVPDFAGITEVNELRDFIAQMRGLTDAATTLVPVPPELAALLPELTTAAWNMLDSTEREHVRWQALIVESFPDDRDRVEAAHRAVADVLARPSGAVNRMERLLLGLSDRLAEPYAFDVFAAGSYNFGILATYRQRWQPRAYQVGDLVATIPLAPGESRRFTQRLAVRRSRSEREADRSLASRREESTQTTRADAEIVQKATTATNFKLSASGAFTVGVVSLSGTSDFAHDQQSESARVKRDFREAVVRAAQEYSRERTVEVSTTSSEDVETTTSGELSNPNNELTVTYLLYELQRRYRVDEHLHRLSPVILVAQDVPAPHEIDEAWLLAHDWILRRVLLDDSLAAALDYLAGGLVSDEASLAIRRADWEMQQRVIERLESALGEQLGARDALRDALVNTIEGRAHAEAEDDTASDVAGAVLTGGLSLLFGSGDDEAGHIEARRKGIELALGFAEESVRAAQEKAKEARAALQAATEAFTKAVEQQAARRTAVDRLRIHVKENILHYMQAIWSHEPPDQRFFRLYDLDVAWVPVPFGSLRLVGPVWAGENVQYFFAGDTFNLLLPTPAIPVGTRKLVEIADLDRLLGYKGNYMIFPLKESCYLTTYMMQEYVDDYLGVRDPDEFGNYTTEELLEYIDCVYQHDDATEEERTALRDALVERLTSPRRDAEDIVVPTGKLFIEALPGTHPLLEDFKLRHRAMDVRKVRAEVRAAELENLRRAARLVAGERGDPDVDKRVLVQGTAGVVVEPD